MTIEIPRKVLEQEFADNMTAMMELVKRYTYNGETPMVSVTDTGATVYIEDKDMADVNRKVSAAFDVCNQGDFTKAKQMLKQLVKDCPIHFDAFRGLAQIAFREGNMDEALDYAITSIHLNPSAIFTILLVGNILTNKGDHAAAGRYYEMAYDIDPENPLTINNIGGNALNVGDFDKAEKFLKLAIEKDPTNLNSYIGLAEVKDRQGETLKAFNHLVEGMKNHTEKIENPGVTEHCFKLMKNLAERSASTIDEVGFIQTVIKELKEKSGMSIRCQEDNTMNLAGRLKYGPVYGTDYHTILYNTKHNYYYYFVLHELTHLRFYLEASKIGKNNITYAPEEGFATFNGKYGSIFSSKISDATQCKQFMRQLFNSLGLQLMNCPLDLLVEDYIAKNYPGIAPIQFLVLSAQEDANIEAHQNAEVQKVFPSDIIRANKILNIVTSLHYKELYNIDNTPRYQASDEEMKEAIYLYDYYKGFKSRETNPGDEYTLVTVFKESLNLSYMIKMVSEDVASKMFGFTFPDNDLKSEQERDKANADFKKSHPDNSNSVETQIMAQLMVDALDYFDSKPKEFIGKVAFEIAQVGLTGISPEKKGYRIPSIDKEFGGFEFLAYYYVSWALVYPTMLQKLQLPFDSAYQEALKIRGNR